MMRTIIISDITETSESIIPYGLNVAKYAETKVDVVHYFDPALVQGVYSPISDSQSITSGQKLSHEEILHREKGITHDKISLLLSREASALNYPLRVNTITEIGDTEKTISSQVKEYDNSLVITGPKPGSSMAVNLQELLLMIRNLDVRILIVPPGKKFIKPNTCCLVTDLLAEGNTKIKKLFHWINPLVTKIFTSAVVRINPYTNHEKDVEEWKAAINPYAEKVHSASPVIIHVDDIDIAFDGICERKNPDMVVLPKNKNSYFSQYLFADHNVKKLIESIRIPVLLY
jgi:hypothetical protein